MNPHRSASTVRWLARAAGPCLTLLLAACLGDVGGEPPAATEPAGEERQPLLDMDELGPAELEGDGQVQIFSGSLPASVDHAGQMTPVRSQGSRGTCLAFASVAAVESYYGLGFHLSVEQMWERMGKRGRLSLWRWRGTRLARESDWPYNGSKPGSGLAAASRWGVDKARSVGTSPTALKQALADDARNNVLVCVKWWRKRHKNGVFYKPDGNLLEFCELTKRLKCKLSKDCGGHCVLVMGYAQRKDRDGKTRTFFKFKNSWGPSWGDSGYGHMSSSYLDHWGHKAYLITRAPAVSTAGGAPQPKGCDKSAPMTASYCGPSCRCGAGEGDCSSDADCQAGLHCVHNVGATYGAAAHVDVCEPAAPASPGAGCHKGAPFGLAYCSPGCPCDAGEGDCDSDADCKPGLHCAQNQGAKHGAPSYVDVCSAGTKVPHKCPPPGAGEPHLGDVSGQPCDPACWGKGAIRNHCGPQMKQICLAAGHFSVCEFWP